MNKTLLDHKKELIDQIEELEAQQQQIIDNLKQNNLMDITGYLNGLLPKNMSRSCFEFAGPENILCYKAFHWCFDNDISYRLVLKRSGDDINGIKHFILMEFKNQADLVAFKLQWLGNNEG